MNELAQSLPYSENAEKGVLCSLILSPTEAGDICLRLLKPEHFNNGAHRTIYETLLEWRSPGPIEFPWLKEEIKKRGVLAEVGGPEFLNEIFTFLPTGSNAKYYVDLVCDAWRERQGVLLAKKLAEGSNFSEVLEKLQAIDSEYKAHLEPKAPVIEFLSPSEICSYTPPAGVVLAGDNHVVRGNVTVVGGCPGVGKSRASVALAEAGATGYDWFGLPVHCKFKTLIVQNENGRFRLKQEFSDLPCDVLDQYVRVTPPPPYGLCFDRGEFRDQLATAIDQFDPGVIVIDPWNATSRDEKARSMLEAFDWIRSVIPGGDSGPAIVIVAHTRKPQLGERSSGRALLNLLAGSYVLGSVPRSVFVMQAATDDVADNRIVWTCCKNNDGELGKRSVWARTNGLFAPVTDFDWDSFDNPESEKREITAALMAEIFADQELTKKDAKDRLIAKGFKQTAAYSALEITGRFHDKLFTTKEGRLKWIP